MTAKTSKNLSTADEAAIRRVAKEDYAVEGELEIDDEAKISGDGEDGGYYVQAWVWVQTPHYDVIVGNIGTVYRGYDEQDALSTFNTYVEQSSGKMGPCRAEGEDVTLMKDGEIEREYVGTLHEDEGDDDGDTDD